MKSFLILLTLSIAFTSCHWFKQKAKDTVNKSGEVVAQAGSEFVDGVRKGVKKTFQSKAELSENLRAKGLQTGKILIASSDSASDNVLAVYFIFNNDFDQTVIAKVFDENGREYGRVSLPVKGLKNEDKYIDFIFDKRTNIDIKDKVVFE